jgi:uncharacterized protein (TIGR02996 family)
VTSRRRDDERALLAAIYDAPEEDAPRAVYADFLQSRGDPRGDFIALQLAAAAAGPDAALASVEAQKLLTRHRRAWLAPFESAVATKTAVFERGFLASCRVQVDRNADLRRLFAPAAWATVKRIDFGSIGRITPAMKALEEALWVPDLGLIALGRAAFPRLRVLSVADGGLWRRRDPIVNGEPHSRGMRALRDAKGLPSLRHVQLAFASDRGPPDYAWLLDSEAGQRLETLVVNEAHDDHAALQRAVRAWVRALAYRGVRGSLRCVALVTILGRLELVVSERGTVQASLRLDAPRSGGWVSVDHASLDSTFDQCVKEGLDVVWRGAVL